MMDWGRLRYTDQFTVNKITDFLKQVKDSTEAEFRLGKETSKFDASVPESEFFHLLEFLGNFQGWEKVTAFTRSVDYFYSWNGKNIRSTVSTADNTIEVEHIQKKTTDSLVIPLGELDVRLSLKEEIVVNDFPNLVESSFVRIKDRKSFTLEGWRYDFTKVCQAKTMSEAERANVHYEVEIECLEPMQLIQNESHTYLAVDFLQKIHSLFPNKSKVILTQ